MTILKKLVVVTGSYQSQGQTKKKYKTIGHVHQGKFGEYITLDASVNLAAFPRRDDDERVMVSIFDAESDKETGRKGIAQAKAAVEEFDTDVPF